MGLCEAQVAGKHRFIAVAVAQGCRLPCTASTAEQRPPFMLCVLRSRSCCR